VIGAGKHDRRPDRSERDEVAQLCEVTRRIVYPEDAPAGSDRREQQRGIAIGDEQIDRHVGKVAERAPVHTLMGDVTGTPIAHGYLMAARCKRFHQRDDGRFRAP